MRTNRISVQSALGLSLLVLGLNSARADLPADTIGQTTLAFPAEAHRAFVVDVEFESFVAGRIHRGRSRPETRAGHGADRFCRTLDPEP